MIAAAAATIAATWPILLIIGALALLGAGIYYLYNHWKGFHDLVNFTWQNILVPLGKTIADSLVPAWKQVSTEVVYLWGRLQDFGNWVSHTFGPILQGMGGALSSAGSFLNAINPWAKHSPSLVENVQSGTAAIVANYAQMSRSVQGSVRVLDTPAYGSTSFATSAVVSPVSTSVGSSDQQSQQLEQIRILLQQMLQLMQQNPDMTGLAQKFLAWIQVAQTSQGRGQRVYTS